MPGARLCSTDRRLKPQPQEDVELAGATHPGPCWPGPKRISRGEPRGYKTTSSVTGPEARESRHP